MWVHGVDQTVSTKWQYCSGIDTGIKENYNDPKISQKPHILAKFKIIWLEFSSHIRKPLIQFIGADFSPNLIVVTEFKSATMHQKHANDCSKLK